MAGREERKEQLGREPEEAAAKAAAARMSDAAFEALATFRDGHRGKGPEPVP